MKILTVTPNPALDLTAQAPNWQVGSVNKVQHAQSDAGGKGINVAALLADWNGLSNEELAVGVTGFLGAGNAAPFERLFVQRGIEDHFLRVEGETRLGIKIVDPATAETTDFNLPGVKISSSQEQDLLGLLAKIGPEQNACVLAGSLPPGISADFYVKAVAQLRGAGCPFIAVDTSGEALRLLLQAETLPHLLKPNIHELEAALERSLSSDEEQIEAARALLKRGAEWVALSLGEKGAWLVSAEGVVKAVPPKVQVVSTVGAGDAMVAGLVSARLAGLEPELAIARATAFSAANITRLGAGLPSLQELMNLQQQVTLKKGS